MRALAFLLTCSALVGHASRVRATQKVARESKPFQTGSHKEHHDSAKTPSTANGSCRSSARELRDPILRVTCPDALKSLALLFLELNAYAELNGYVAACPVSRLRFHEAGRWTRPFKAMAILLLSLKGPVAGWHHCGASCRSALKKSFGSIVQLPRTIGIPMSSSAGDAQDKLNDALHHIVTYNVLSSSLCDPGYFIYCKPEHLDPANRLAKLRVTLRREMEQGTIICLQEVSNSWAAELHTFFQLNDYHFVFRGYGNPFNGYMGVGIAFPNRRYKLLDTDLSRIADTRNWPSAPELPRWKKVRRAVVRLPGRLKRMLLRQPPPREPTNAVEFAKRRFNTMVSVKLQPRDGLNLLAVATYHMPCAFFLMPVMNIHTALCARRAIAFAGEDALVLCGDFNFKPSDPSYHILTQGCLASDELATHMAECVASGTPDSWVPSLDSERGAFRSAYVEDLGAEPDFTNHAQTSRNTKPFIECLDYIFLRDGAASNSRIAVKSTRKLAHRDNVTDGPFPNQNELSDHVMLSATVSVM